MSLTSLMFIIFVLTAVIGYYCIPKRYQWLWLLFFSYIYYLSTGARTVYYLLITTASTYLVGYFMSRIQKDKDDRAARRVNRRLLVLALLLNFGMLAYLKYTNFLIANLNDLLHAQLNFKDLLLPLGISFYTFQSMGYLLDVYWKKCEAETNPLRLALFVSFFPQILQGPIGRFSRLGKQLFTSHTVDWEQMERSFLLILYGFFKKMILADTVAPIVDHIFGNPTQFSGVFMIIGVLGYSAQLYGDFSGGMDVVQGVSGLFGITLDDNFKRPFFAISITDFWHRWHITLGTWMKDYVFYPISLSKWMSRFSKYLKTHLSKKLGRTIPICIANILVFLIVGVWHGAAWKYIIYGLYNGVIIGISGLLTNCYRDWKKALHIQDKSHGWHIFQILRTFLLVNISWFFDRADTVKDALFMMKNTILNFHISVLWDGSLLMDNTILHIQYRYIIVITACLVVFIISLLQEKKITFAQSIYTWKPAVRFVLYLVILFVIPLLGQTPMAEGGFIYAQF